MRQLGGGEHEQGCGGGSESAPQREKIGHGVPGTTNNDPGYCPQQHGRGERLELWSIAQGVPRISGPGLSLPAILRKV